MKKKMKTTLFKLEQDRWGIYWVEVPPTDGVPFSYSLHSCGHVCTGAPSRPCCVCMGASPSLSCSICRERMRV